MQQNEKISEFGRAVILTEANTIKALVDKIDHHFTYACNLLLECKGRIIVIGMGKSGHIGKKIAATFASTGSPAFFIHPSEALHGDFGMITPTDIALVLSNSGETTEILNLVPYIKALGIPLVSMTGNIFSYLSQQATVNIDVSVAKEACPLGLAPSASTTAALVMGDALALTLSQLRGFTAEDYAKSHPGGSLGKKLLLRVDDIMHAGGALPKINSEASLKTALLEITEKKLGLTTVVNTHNELTGLFTDGDLRRAFDNHSDINTTFIREVMTLNPKVIPLGTLAINALHIMKSARITSLVVTSEKNHPLGIVHLHDILRAGVL